VTPLTDQLPRSAAERRERLKALFAEAQHCSRCPDLARSRRTVVFGAGNADADLMFVGEAPGANEDEQGLPFVGRAGKLLDTLLAEIGMARGEVFITNVLLCRPPGNRDPLPAEIEHCEDYLYRKVQLIQPRVICSLGNFATKLLRGDPAGITRVHGQPEILTVGTRAVRIHPLYHPAAALRTPTMLDALRADFARIPELLRAPAPEQPGERPELDLPDLEALLPEEALLPARARAGGSQSGEAREGAQGDSAVPVAPDQLGLF
jgi:uracil-DNA glycosylase family 4